jgi:hypothetical protein
LDPLRVANIRTALAAGLNKFGGAPGVAQAESMLRQALEVHRKHLGPLHPSIAYDLSYLSACLLGQGKTDEAELYARECVDMTRKLSPDQSYWAYFENLIRILVENHKVAEAESLVEEQLQRFPNEAMSWSLAAELQASRGDWDAALASFSKSVELTEYGDYWNLMKLALAYLHEGRTDEYRTYCRQLIERATISPNLLYKRRIAWTCLIAPLPPEDQASVFAIVSALPDSADPWDKLLVAVCDLRAGNFNDALAKASTVTDKRLDPASCGAVAYFIQARAFAVLGELTKARQAIEKGDVLSPNDPEKTRVSWDWMNFWKAKFLRDEAAQAIKTAEPKESRSL